MFCHVSSEQVLGVHDVSSVYHVPLMLQAQGIVEYLTRRLGLDKLGVDGRTTPSLAERSDLNAFGLNGVVNGLSLSKDLNLNTVVGSGRGVEEQETVWEARRAKGRELGMKWRDLTAGCVFFIIPPISC
jgi:CTP synthase